MSLLPVFPIRLLMLALPVLIAAGLLAYAGTRGVSAFKKQGVAWCLTALMIVAAIGIGYGKAHAFHTAEPAPPYASHAVESVPPGLQQGSATFPSYVRDDAGVLSDKTERALYERSLRLYGDYGVVIGVVTCNYGRDDLYNYALKQAEEMNLGGYDFIVALDIRGDNYWLVQGADLVDDFTDDDCSDFAYDCMERYFAAGDYDSAVLKLTKALEDWYSDYFN